MSASRTTLKLFAAASFAVLALAACDNKADVALAPPASTVDDSQIDASAIGSAEENIRKAQDFVTAAGQAGLVEIRTSEMALTKSKSVDVKAFARMMIDQHTAAGESLAAAAGAAALKPPLETLDDFHMRRISDLVETDGDADFDADYMHLQIDAHNDAIKLFEDYAKNGQISQVKDFAIATLPTLLEHKTKAEQISGAVKGSSPPS